MPSLKLFFLTGLATLSVASPAGTKPDTSMKPAPHWDIECSKPFAWFCPSPGMTAFCNKRNELVEGRICAKGTCCSVEADGIASCTKAACKTAVDPDKTGKSPTWQIECRKPFAWFCPSEGITAFCNKRLELVDGQICPKDTCCGVNAEGVAECTKDNCLPTV